MSIRSMNHLSAAVRWMHSVGRVMLVGGSMATLGSATLVSTTLAADHVATSKTSIDGVASRDAAIATIELDNASTDDSDDASSTAAQASTAAQVSTDAPASTTAPLSVPPLDFATYPNDRPAWIDEPTGPRVMVVKTGLVDSLETAEQQIKPLAVAAIETQARLVVDVIPRNYDIDAESLIDDVVQWRYSGSATRGGETAYEAAYLLRFDDDVVQKFQVVASAQERRDRVAALGVCAMLGAALLAMMTGTLKLAERKFVRGRSA